MTTVPRWARRRAACGLAAIIATVSTLLAVESPAGAAIDTHSPNPQQTAGKRNIGHERLLRDIRKPRDARQAATDPKAGKAPEAAAPPAIAAPSIGLAADLMTLSGPDGTAGPDDPSLPVPPLAKAATDAGWYQFTAVPGATGNAVIVGHVDTYVGPAVFYNLYQLRPGDPVYVDAGGTRQRFDVTSVSELPKTSFPVNQVFGSTQRHMLWLITCGGAFDYETGHYVDNIVVSAIWAPAAEKHAGTREKVRAKRPENHQETVR